MARATGRWLRWLAIPLVSLLLATGVMPAQDVGGAPRATVREPENFLWLFGRLYRDPAVFDDLVAFAGRHDLSVVLAPASVSQTPARRSEIERALARLEAEGIPVLFNTGVFRASDGWPTGGVLLGDSSWRAAYVDSLQAMAALYLRYYPGGRVIVGHEDPLFSNWPERDADSYRRHGAAMFRLQRSAVRAVDPDARVGIFVLPSHVLDMYRVFMPELRDGDALPDFSMIDRYRGYTDPSRGIAGTNAETEHLLREAARMTDGRPIFYLGQDHTINTGYTPSRRAIRENATAAIAAGVRGIGWYIRTRYVPTDSISTLEGRVTPFQPLTGKVDRAEFNTFTGARDRFMFAYLTTFEEQGVLDPEGRFDLWIHGTDMDLHEARVSVRDTAGSWRFLGHVGATVGGRHDRAPDDRRATVVFRGLRRSELLGGGPDPDPLQLRIAMEKHQDGLSLHGIYAMPYTPTDRFITEAEATAQLIGSADTVQRRSIAYRSWAGRLRLEVGDTLTVRTAGW